MQHLIDPDTALALVLEHARTTKPQSVSVYDAAGLCLAESISADTDYPPFDRSMMDGYAVCIADAGSTVRVVAEVAAGATAVARVIAGSTVEIMTGAPCPAGTEAVVAKEDITRDADRVMLPDVVKAGQNITRRGAECAKGATVLKSGNVITPVALASIVTFGIERVSVYPKPSLAIITTGDELVPPRVTPGPSQIRNSNGPMLAAMAQSLNLPPALLLHANDTMEELQSALAKAGSADVIVLTGAVSAGKYDTVPDALRAFGATPIFHKVLQRPGKPIFFATRGTQLIFGLPGNPLSCHLGFHRYVAPALRKLMDRDPAPAKMHGKLAVTFAVKGPRTVFQLARANRHENAWQVTPLLGKGSADIYAPANANAMLRFAPGSGTLAPGSPVEFEWLLGQP